MRLNHLNLPLLEDISVSDVSVGDIFIRYGLSQKNKIQNLGLVTDINETQICGIWVNSNYNFHIKKDVFHKLYKWDRVVRLLKAE